MPAQSKEKHKRRVKKLLIAVGRQSAPRQTLTDSNHDDRTSLDTATQLSPLPCPGPTTGIIHGSSTPPHSSGNGIDPYAHAVTPGSLQPGSSPADTAPAPASNHAFPGLAPDTHQAQPRGQTLHSPGKNTGSTPGSLQPGSSPADTAPAPASNHVSPRPRPGHTPGPPPRPNLPLPRQKHGVDTRLKHATLQLRHWDTPGIPPSLTPQRPAHGIPGPRRLHCLQCSFPPALHRLPDRPPLGTDRRHPFLPRLQRLTHALPTPTRRTVIPTLQDYRLISKFIT